MSLIGPVSGYSSYGFQSLAASSYAKRLQIGSFADGETKANQIQDADKKVSVQDTKSVRPSAISEDGDTFLASSTGRKQLADGVVLQKPLTTDENKTGSATGNSMQLTMTGNLNGSLTTQLKDGSLTADSSDQKVDGSLTGYTADQLETMYLQGKISMIDYDEEIDRRAELELLGKSSSDEQNQDTGADATDTEKNAGQVNSNVSNQVQKSDNGYAPVAENNKSEDLKEDKKTQEQKEQDRKNLIQQEIQSDTDFAKEMGSLFEDKSTKQMQAQGLQEAYENDRMDLVGNVFAPKG